LLAACLLAAHLLVALSGSAQAQELPAEERGDSARVAAAPVEWNPAWPKFQTGEWIAGGVGIAAALASRILPLPSSHWQGGIGIDESARDALRLHTPAARRRARDGSDIALTINVSWPFFDALVVAGWYRDSPEVGVQQALISAEVLAVTAGMQGLASYFTSRERPYGRECGDELPANTRDCVARDRVYSFYSGHSAAAFASAGVNCMHHAYVPLYGGGAADDWACAGMFGVAATTALLRVATDVHYVSDVAMGALIGTTTGLLLPWALHYRHGAAVKRGVEMDASAPRDLQLTVVPSISPGFGGLYGVLVF
jgi:membrane-associated phospholipid phosphatase